MYMVPDLNVSEIPEHERKHVFLSQLVLELDSHYRHHFLQGKLAF